MITKKTLEFLHENRFRNSREWYQQHKDVYQTEVIAPLRELVEQLGPAIKKIDPLIATAPKSCISRVYRDTRFSKDKSLYRDVMWIVFTRPKQQAFLSSPGFFMEFSPNGWRYGMGYYQAPPKTMAVVRQMILDGDKLAIAAMEAFDRQQIFAMEGECYKRPRYPDQPEKLRNWLERRNMDWIKNSQDFELLYSPQLAQVLAEGFALLAPIYQFLTKAEELAEVK